MRRDLSPDQRRACLVDLHDLEAEHRGGDHGNQHTGGKAETVAALPRAGRSIAADSVAKAMGESPRTSHKQVVVKKKAPELHEAVKDGKLTTNQAVQLAKATEGERKSALKAIDGGKSANQVVAAHKRKEKQAHVAKTARGFEGMDKYGDSKAFHDAAC